MTSVQPSTQPGNGRRRFYVFLAVALGQFIFAMALFGTLCQGFAIHDPEAEQATAKARSDALAARQAARRAEAEVASAVKAFTEARRSAHVAMQEYDVARRKLLDYVQQGLETPTSKTEVAATPSTPHPVPNPEWKKLRDKLGDLLRQRNALLTKMTLSHPTVKALDLTIAEVESQIAEMPEVVEDPANDKVATSVNVAADSEDAAAAGSTMDREHAKTLALAADASRQQFEQKLAAEDAAWAQQSKAIDDAMRALGDVATAPVEPATAAKASGASVPYSIVCAAIWAIAIAWLVARKACVNEKAFQSPAEVRHALDLPVLGLLTSNPQAVKESPRREPVWVRRTVLTCEAWLVGVAVMLAVVSLLDTSFFQAFLADPLDACSKRFW